MSHNTHLKIAYFVSSHGFGHAARSTAVMQALIKKIPEINIEIFTQTPEWFFAESIKGNFCYYTQRTDVGLYQSNPFDEDIPKTLEELNGFYPLKEKLLEKISKKLKDSAVDLVICDISPLGLLAARQANIPSVLVENFTWDWIYMNYLTENMHFNAHIQYLATVFANCNYHIKTIPFCQGKRPGRPDYTASEQKTRKLT